MSQPYDAINFKRKEENGPPRRIMENIGSEGDEETRVDFGPGTEEVTRPTT